jgi:Fe-Mn family superoxide dismutase
MHRRPNARPRALLRRVAATLALVVAPCLAAAQFELAPLPYPNDALEPFIDRATMEIHHGRHHKAYVDNLNAQIEQAPELAKLSLEDLQGQISRFSTAVRNNGGGHYNHTLFWGLMAPEGQRGAPDGALLADIVATFGSLEAMQAQFEAAALGRFGSGWAWLIVTPTGELAITSTANQDNPLMDLPDIVRGTPILALDVWEHAYYLKYQNRRAEYAKLWWNVVDWHEVARRYAAATTALQSRQ